MAACPKALCIAAVVLAAVLVAAAPEAHERAVYQPTLAVPEFLEPYLKQLEPGNDAFLLERAAQELDGRLRELADAVRGGSARVTALMPQLLDSTFRGARLISTGDAAAARSPLEVRRSTDLPREATLDARAFAAELRRLTDESRSVAVA